MITSKPWENEPDYLEDEFCGYKFEVKRNLHTGSLCGYVTIPKTNPFYSIKDYDDHLLTRIDIHGGWTYYSDEDHDKVIGFDCAHYGDLVPMMEMMMEQLQNANTEDQRTYKDFAFVTDQCKRACWILAGNTFTSKLNEALYQRYANGE